MMTPLIALLTSAPSAFEMKRRDHAGHERTVVIKDRAKPVAVRFHDRLEPRHPGRAKLIRVVNLQNRVFLDHGK